MKILSAQQIREADAYTIAHEPVSSLALMERAASRCADWLIDSFGDTFPFYIFCGMGNNGGDGLVIARLLQQKGCRVRTWLVHHSSKASTDNEANRFEGIQDIHALSQFPVLSEPGILVDAIFGTGLSRPVEGWVTGVLHRINEQRDHHMIVSIDIPSGLMADKPALPCVHAHHTLSFQVYKLTFMQSPFPGQVEILDIGLHPDYMAGVQTKYHITDADILQTIYQPRDAFAHKGTYGHALIIAGSYGKMGAAILATRACLRAGAGLVTAHVPQSAYAIMQTAVPEAMCQTESQELFSTHFHEPFRAHQAPSYTTIGIGPGIGMESGTAKALEKLLEHYRKPMVLDADALNILGAYPFLQQQLPQDSILTPHPKEFGRLFGATEHKLEKLAEKAAALKVYILLKGRYSAMACPDGSVYFNPTGNPGMATGGSGDVLTGILTGLLAQGYTSKAALLLGAWLHGKAGDLAANAGSQESLIAGDIIEHLGHAYRLISRP